MNESPFRSEPRLKGRAREGILYQEKVHSAITGLGELGPLYEGPWFRYHDATGQHWCQPDHVLDAWDRVLCVESKLSLRQLSTAVVQLGKLYSPVLGMFFNKPVVTVVAFKHWKSGSDLELIPDPRHLLSMPLSSLRRPLGWHYLGI